VHAHDVHLNSSDASHPGVHASQEGHASHAAAIAQKNPLAHVHLTQDPEAFKSRVAAIRKSVSHISGQLDDLKK
jgi:hypothetical protein